MITDKGFIVPTIDEIYTRKLNDFKAVKPDLRETDSNIIIAWLRFDSAEEYDSYLQALTAFNELSVYTATGSNLNAITSHLGMTWEKEKKAVGKITVTAEIGTQIPQAWGVETKSGVQFVTLNTSTITTTARETEIEVMALEGGTDGNVSSGAITEQTEISYECICYGDTNDNILKALYEYKIAGIRTVGAITKNFDEISVGFTRPTEKTVFLKVEIQGIKEVWRDEFKKTIKDIYLKYIDEVEPNSTIYLYKLIGEIYKNTSGIKTLKIKLGDVKYSEREQDYKLSNKEVAVANADDITIEVNL